MNQLSLDRPATLDPCVYVVNEPLSADGTRMMNFRPALRFGQLRYVMPAGQPPSNPETILDMLRDRLSGFRARDYLLLVGDLVTISCAVTIAAAESGGIVQLLRWQRGEGGERGFYELVVVDLTNEIGVDDDEAIVTHRR